MAEDVRAGTHIGAEGREFQIAGAATLKLRAPNEVRTYGMENKLVCDNLRQQVE